MNDESDGGQTDEERARAIAGRRQLPLDFTDLLLLLIATLASNRLIGQLAIWLLASGIEVAPSQRLGLTLTLMLLQSFILIAVVRWLILRRHRLSWSDIGLRPPPRGWVMRAVLVGLACVPLVGLVNLAFQALSGGPVSNPQLQALAPAGFSWPAAVAVTIVTASIVPFAEEIVFRGLAYRWLRDRFGVTAAALLSAIVFAALHGIPQLIPAIAVLGLVLAWSTQSSGSLWPAVIVHGVFNGSMTILLYTAVSSGMPLS